VKSNSVIKAVAAVAVLFTAATYSSKEPSSQPLNAVSAPQVIVYVTKTGEKYHRGTCQYLRLSKIEITLDAAIRQGYDPCSVCKPPVK